jgi:hypothetical protein
MRRSFHEISAQPPCRSSRSTNPPREEIEHRWRKENAAAIASSNACAEEKGLPLAGLRPF